MKKTILIFILILTSSAFSSLSQRVYLNVSSSSNPSKIFQLGFGIDPAATDTLDKNLGELLLPPPPPTFYTAMEYIDSTKNDEQGNKFYDVIWTNLDLKGIPENMDKWLVKYKLIINWASVQSVKIEWNSQSISDNVDSIFIKDVFDGLVINQNMKTSNSITLNNDAMDKLIIYAYYTKNPSEVNVTQEFGEHIFPSPINDKLTVNYDYDYIEFYDVLGNKVLNANNTNSIGYLKQGIYQLIVYKNHSILDSKLILKN